jgi:hypothetical protein
MSRFLFLTSVIFSWPIMASTAIPLGDKEIYLKDNDGAERLIGTISFSDGGHDTAQYDLHMETERFKDFFLSMKEMKCLEGKEIWCFIPYPYEHPDTVSADDLRWLEHDLLFMYKALNAFGADLWNGVYYNLAVEDGVIRGSARAVDLNYIAGPPDDLSVPPYGKFDIGDLETSSRWLPFIEIR